MILMLYVISDSNRTRSGKKIRCSCKHFTDPRLIRAAYEIARGLEMNPKLTETEYGFRLVVEA